MGTTRVIACCALLIAITGTRGVPVLEARNGTAVGRTGAPSNETTAGAVAVVCRNNTDRPCSPGFDTIVGVIQNATTNATNVPGFDTIVGVIQNATANTTKVPGFDTIVGVIQNATANTTRTPGFDTIVGVIQNGTGTPKCAAAGIVTADSHNSNNNNTVCLNNTAASLRAATRATGYNTTLRNDTIGERMLNDEGVPKINETVDGDRSVCPPLVTLEAWGGRPPLRVERVRPPVPWVVVHHTYIPAACNASADCEAKMRQMQDFHMAKGWLNVGYNFVVGGDGRVYVGRGWDVVGAHSPVYNFKSVGISFIGDYRNELPTAEMLDLARSLIACGVARGSISPSYKLVGHRQVRDTECPGERLYREIQAWPHWADHRDIVPRVNVTNTTAKPSA